MICRLVLVVHCGHGRDPERARRGHLGIRVMRERDVRSLPHGEASEQPDTIGERRDLAGPAPRTRPADNLHVGPDGTCQLNRLGVVASGQDDFMAQVVERTRHRLEDQRVRRVGQVDPDPHRAATGSPMRIRSTMSTTRGSELEAGVEITARGLAVTPGRRQRSRPGRRPWSRRRRRRPTLRQRSAHHRG